VSWYYDEMKEFWIVCSGSVKLMRNCIWIMSECVDSVNLLKEEEIRDYSIRNVKKIANQSVFFNKLKLSSRPCDFYHTMLLSN
jgi:hypothetical protein